MRNVRRLQCQTRDGKVNDLMPLLEGQREWRGERRERLVSPTLDLIGARLRRMVAARLASARPNRRG